MYFFLHLIMTYCIKLFIVINMLNNVLYYSYIIMILCIITLIPVNKNILKNYLENFINSNNI